MNDGAVAGRGPCAGPAGAVPDDMADRL